MYEMIIMVLVLLLPLIISIYFLIHIRFQMTKLKIKLSQNNLALRSLYKKTQTFEQKLVSILQFLEESKQYKGRHPKDDTEYQYERARRMISHGTASEQDILQSCDMTLEEIELLAGLMQE